MIVKPLPGGNRRNMQEQDIVKYCNLMEEVKCRTTAINAFGSGQTTTPYGATNIEFVYLQFRKMLELIALGSLVANKNEFIKAYGDYSKCWNAQYLLRDMERINPQFYPHPIIEVPTNQPGARMEWQDKQHGFLTKNE